MKYPYIFLFSLAILVLSSCQTDYRTKEMFINHVEKAEVVDSTHLSIPLKPENKGEYYYYTHMTVTLMDNNSYMIILWGNRDSFWWSTKRDYRYMANIPYMEYQDEYILFDRGILDIIKMKLKDCQ